ncbi:hypothetical protein PV10_05961 [Exophiala mesophila]|uniref:Alpha/beta hydrolase fold-3 domain-containing protein n=1 Tax=Exophiala mesophila TaxID=212818 RepID=A0A0D1ZBV1_EXOME|nr:uncharacterized protein PV10_05961 [Exophiala mesophila]KIV91419.1 hypothetical protein PV10_05961 [Exophiala mesophila]
MSQSNESHITVEAAKFGPKAIPKETTDFNESLMKLMDGSPKWFEVGAKRYREMRAAGETPLPKSTLLDSAEQSSIPSRDSGRSIPCRILRPQNGKPVKSVFLHIHGGGWVLGDEKSQDPALQDIANTTGMLAVTIGYRLAPEHPFPAGPNDCYDAVEWLVDNAEREYGQPLGFIGGESAGAHLSMLVAIHLLQHSNAKYSSFKLKGLLLHFGCYSMLWTPSVYTFKKPVTLVLDKELMDNFADAFLPGMSDADKRNPLVSPIYADLEALRGRLPPALYTCGTEDCLLDDTLFMSTKWLAAGGEAVVKIIPGAPHGYIMFPRSLKASAADQGLKAVEDFVMPRF